MFPTPRIGGTVLVLLLLAACGAPPATPEPTLPPRPAVPAQWRTVTSDEGDVVMAIPRELVVTITSGGVQGFAEQAGAGQIDVWAMGPGTLALRPGQSIEEWIDASSWLSGQWEGAVLGPVRRTAVMLPAGPAIEMTAGYTVDGEEAWTFLYAIDTRPGFAVFRAGGPGPPPDGLPEELALIRDLAVFRTR